MLTGLCVAAALAQSPIDPGLKGQPVWIASLSGAHADVSEGISVWTSQASVNAWTRGGLPHDLLVFFRDELLHGVGVDLPFAPVEERAAETLPGTTTEARQIQPATCATCARQIACDPKVLMRFFSRTRANYLLVASLRYRVDVVGKDISPFEALGRLLGGQRRLWANASLELAVYGRSATTPAQPAFFMEAHGRSRELDLHPFGDLDIDELTALDAEATVAALRQVVRYARDRFSWPTAADSFEKKLEYLNRFAPPI